MFYPRELTSMSVAHSERSRPRHQVRLTSLKAGRRGSRGVSEPPGLRWPSVRAIGNTSPRTHDRAKTSQFPIDPVRMRLRTSYHISKRPRTVVRTETNLEARFTNFPQVQRSESTGGGTGRTARPQVRSWRHARWILHHEIFFFL